MVRKSRVNWSQYIDQEFGFLRIIDITTRINPYIKHKTVNATYFICNCQCGNKQVEISASSIKSGHAHSCGCQKGNTQKRKGKNSTSFTGYEEIPGLYWSAIERNAIARHIVFDLKIEDAWILFLKQNRKCSLSNVPIRFGGRKELKTASLDRINPMDGYVLNNVQWIHKKVNIMKNVFTNKEFIDWCVRISSNQPNNYEPDDTNISSKWDNYKTGARILSKKPKGYTDVDIERAVQESICYTGVMQKLGLQVHGPARTLLQRKVEKLGYSTKHFQK